MAISSIIGASCDLPAHAAGDLPRAAVDLAAPKPDEKERAAVFGGGCFWCVEGVFEQLAGVKDVTSGYAGGKKETANYRAVCNGDTGHAEVVKITYDPAKISFGELLRVFFATHDPTTKNRQGPDAGTQYRSAIFFENDEQKKVAQAYIDQLEKARVFTKPIVTTLEPLDAFYPAEDYHQNYVQQNPDKPYIQHWAQPKIEKVRDKFKEAVKPEPKK